MFSYVCFIGFFLLSLSPLWFHLFHSNCFSLCLFLISLLSLRLGPPVVSVVDKAVVRDDGDKPGVWLLLSFYFLLVSKYTVIVLEMISMLLLPTFADIIHSFIQAISIAPLQVCYYSEALQTQHGYCARVSCWSATGNCELKTCPRSLRGRKASTLTMRHHVLHYTYNDLYYCCLTLTPPINA